MGNYIVVRPGRRNGMKIPYSRYRELTQAVLGDIIPLWLAGAASRAWDLDLSGRPVAGTVLVRPESPFGYGRASY
ncbi:MAG: radical SAM protein, partial [Actinomycetes bacterium]